MTPVAKDKGSDKLQDKSPEIVKEDTEDVPEGAPKTESPEAPAAAPVEGIIEAMPMTLTDAQTTVTGPRALELDTGIATVPVPRPSTFSPVGSGSTFAMPRAAADYGQATQITNRLNTVDEDPSIGVVLSPSPGY